jgi:hypothetical protein
LGPLSSTRQSDHIATKHAHPTMSEKPTIQGTRFETTTMAGIAYRSPSPVRRTALDAVRDHEGHTAPGSPGCQDGPSPGACRMAVLQLAGDILVLCLLLPRTVLLQTAKQGRTAERIARNTKQASRWPGSGSTPAACWSRSEGQRPQSRSRFARPGAHRAYHGWYTSHVPQEIHRTVPHRRDKDCQCPQLRPLAR